METAVTAELDRFKELFFVLEDLIKRVADTDDPKIRRMRARLREDLVELKGDMTPIQYALRPEPRRASSERCTSSWPQPSSSQRTSGHHSTDCLVQPALAALTGVAVALTVLR